jgi:hypothetical protein
MYEIQSSKPQKKWSRNVGLVVELPARGSSSTAVADLLGRSAVRRRGVSNIYDKTVEFLLRS